MTAVWTTTDEFPALGEHIAWRHERGLDTYDEWWNGVYRIVTGPSPEHGELLVALVRLVGSLADTAGLRMSLPVNIGIDKANCRVPDLGVYRPDTPRTSPAFLGTAELVVEVLSPGERAGEKLLFYWQVGVREYLELDLVHGAVELLRARPLAWASAESWRRAEQSEVLPGLRVTPHEVLVRPDRGIDLRDFAIG